MHAIGRPKTVLRLEGEEMKNLEMLFNGEKRYVMKP